MFISKRTTKIWANIAALMLLMFLTLQQPAIALLAQDQEIVAFVNVNVIPMDTERVLEAQTVLVQGERIVEIGAIDTVVIPSGAQVVEGNGAYLIPGLADAHVHILDNQDALLLFIANGVTTVRDPNADYFGTGKAILQASDEITLGNLLGPTLRAAKSFANLPPRFAALFPNMDHTVGPWLSVDRTFFELSTDPLSGRELVFKAHEEGYDFVKINWFLSRETFDSIVATAAELGMPVLAHIPADVGIEHAIRSGVEIQHNYNLQAFVAKDYVRRPGANALDTFDLSEADQKLPELVALMKENDVAFTPTMIVDVAAFELFDNLPDWSQGPTFRRPEYQYVPPSYMTLWADPTGGEIAVLLRDSGASSIEEIVPPPAARKQTLAYQLRQLKELVDAGVPVLVGTDSSAIGVVWGFSIHQELELFVKAGLTPYQALSAATRIPSQVMGDPDEWGTIEVGKRADMVLLSSNPLQEISSTRQIEGVMVRGRWLPQAELQIMLDEVAAKYEAQAQGIAQLEEFSTELFSGLVPTGWHELEPGIYARGNPEVDPTVFAQIAVPNVPAEALALKLLARFNLSELPALTDRVETPHLAWDIYLIEQEPGILGLALTEHEGVAYLVMLVTTPDQADMLAKTLFFPALTALTPVE